MPAEAAKSIRRGTVTRLSASARREQTKTGNGAPYAARAIVRKSYALATVRAVNTRPAAGAVRRVTRVSTREYCEWRRCKRALAASNQPVPTGCL